MNNKVWHAIATQENHGLSRAKGHISGDMDLSIFSVKQPQNLGDVINLLFVTAHKYYGDNGIVLLKLI
jgi:hypothetical protein